MPKISKWQEWAIPTAILAGLFVILTPLPTAVIDFLLAANLIAAIMILSAALLVRSSSELSVFPAILLISTLGRLVLNISTTRLILSNATTAEDLAAGGIIKSFGEFVIGNEVFVGLVIFAIIFVVQFVVVTKGTSRISEVAARFALDGMPGKQMAIDADLKSKLITPEEARDQRESIQSHADFLGAMDGAGRFVRGDAIAGVVITVVNIVGGLAIGLFNGMSFSRAVDVYTRLTIGDGLVSQIPAFLIAISAGILMARGSKKSSVSNDLVSQIVSDPRVLFFAGFGATALVFAGLPPIPLFIIAGGCFFIGANRHFQLKQIEKDNVDLQQKQIAQTRVKPTEQPLEELLRVDPIEVRLGLGIVKIADRSKGGTLFDDVNTIRKSLLREYGFILPKVRICDSPQLKENQFEIYISGNRVSDGRIQIGASLAIDDGNVKSALQGGKPESTLLGENCFWISSNQEHRAEYLRYRVYSATEVVAAYLRETAIQFAPELLTRDSAGRLIDELKKQTPVVVDELIPNKLSLSHVQKVLKNLLQEGVSIRQLGLILETLGDYSPQTNHVGELTGLVRRQLSRSICTKLSTNNVLDVVGFEKSIEKRLIEQSEMQFPGTRDEEFGIGEKEFNWFANEVKKLKRPGRECVLLVDGKIRAWIKEKTSSIRPLIHVLAYDEICSGIETNPLGEISLGPNLRKAA